MIVILSHHADDVHGDFFEGATSSKLAEKSGVSDHVEDHAHILISIRYHLLPDLLNKVGVFLHEVAERLDFDFADEH